MQGRVGAHHEMFNGQMKSWGIHSQVFHHRIIYSLHGDVSRGCVNICLLLRLQWGWGVSKLSSFIYY